MKTEKEKIEEVGRKPSTNGDSGRTSKKEEIWVGKELCPPCSSKNNCHKTFTLFFRAFDSRPQNSWGFF